MSRNKLGLYKLAKYTNLEIVLDSQVQSSGANQARLMEKFKKNKNSIKYQVFAMRFAYGFIFGMTALLLVVFYFPLTEFINSGTISIESILFGGSIMFGIFFGMQLVYLTFMGMFAIGSMMSGEVFQWFETLPLSKNRLQKLGFITVLRNLDLAFIMMILSFPLVIGILSQNFLLIIVSSLISILQVILAFSVLILVAEKIGRILKVESIGSKKSTMIRVFTMLAYIIVVMSASLFIQWAVSAISSFFIIVSAMNVSYIVIFFISMIPFPFAPSILITMLMDPLSFPPIQWIPTIIGMLLLILLTMILYNKAVKSMRSITSSTLFIVKKARENKLKQSGEEIISINKVSPIKSYIKKDLSIATRDIQMFMFLLMPMIMPLLIVFVFGFIPSEEFGDVFSYLIAFWSLLMFYQPIISLMIVSGFLNVEDTGATITAALPLNPRDQAKAKLILLVIIQTVSFFLPVIVILFITPSLRPFIPLFISWYPIALLFLLNAFSMKIRMFGRMKYKFVLEEVNPEKKVMKWTALIITQFLILAGYILIGSLFLLFGDLIIMTIVLAGTSLIAIILLILSLNSMFPKEFGRKEMISIRESFRKYPLGGTVVLLILYGIFLFLPGFIELPLIFVLDLIPDIVLLLIDFFISFGFMVLLWLIIVPRVIHLPIGNQKLRGFTKSIGLNLRDNLIRNIMIGLGCSIIFFLSSFIMANIFGTYYFDLEVIFGIPNLTIFRLGWFYFVIMLIPGIWEEISFRGVMITMNLKRYTEFTSLIVVSVIFGLFHFVNLIGGQNLIATIIQAVFATFLGLLFGYMFIQTKSLVPSIITHYLIDSAGQLFMNAYFTNLSSYFLFAILGIGIIPMILGMLYTGFVMKLTRKK